MHTNAAAVRERRPLGYYEVDVPVHRDAEAQKRRGGVEAHDRPGGCEGERGMNPVEQVRFGTDEIDASEGTDESPVAGGPPRSWLCDAVAR